MPRILIVDDDVLLLANLVREFERCGFEVLSARNAEEAGQKLKDCLPDLIVLDVMMPGEDGFSFLGELKKSQAWKDVPVVMLTAKDQERDIYEGWQKGAVAYLTKPFTKEEVVLMVKGVLKDRAQRGEEARFFQSG